MVGLRAWIIGGVLTAALSPVAAQPALTPPTAEAVPSAKAKQALPQVTRPSPWAPGGPSEPRAPREVGAMIGVAIGLGTQSTFMLDGRIGAVVHPNVAVFAEAFGVGTAYGGGWLLGGGGRLMNRWGFLEARVGRMSTSSGCDFDDPCTTRTSLGSVLGAGLEVFHGAHGGFEVRTDVVRVFADTVVELGLGGSFYIF